MEGIQFATRARNTQIAWVRKFLRGEAYEDPEMKYAKEHGKDIHDMMLAVPEGHRFYPARIYPPYRVPAGQRVPYPPDAFTLWKKQPAHAFITTASMTNISCRKITSAKTAGSRVNRWSSTGKKER